MTSVQEKLTSSFAAQKHLPVMGRKDEIVQAITANKVTILTSETGSGKTTLIPIFCLEMALKEQDTGAIACTQPRKMAAASVAKQVAKQVGVKIGDEIGYAARFGKRVSEKTRVCYTTDGHLLQMMTQDPDLKSISYVILDEVHERSVPTELLVALLKVVVERRTNLKLVIMSATLNADKLSAFYNNAPVVSVTGRQYKVGISYMSEPIVSVTLTVVTTVLQIHKTKPKGNILVFMRGADEIETVCKILQECPEAERLILLPLYSAFQGGGNEVFQEQDGRKCIVSTNVAETSITVPGIVYVIDTGVCKELVYNPRVRMEQLQSAPISQSSADQRAGRAGRTADGICIRLYTKETFEKIMPLHTMPKIMVGELNEPILKIMKAGHTDILRFNMLDKFAPEALLRGVDELLTLGMLKDGGLSERGQDAARFPASPIWYHAIIEAGKLGCRSEMFSMAAIDACKHSVFLMSQDMKAIAHKAREMFAYPKSDHITRLNALHAFGLKLQSENIDMDLWCKEHMLNHAALEEIISIRSHLVNNWKDMYPKDDINQSYSIKNADYGDRLRQALARGLFMNTAHFIADDCYTTIHDNFRGLIEPHSSLVGATNEWIVYSKFRLGAKMYFDVVTAIEPEWIEDMEFFQTERMPVKFGKPKQTKVLKSLQLARERKGNLGWSTVTDTTEASKA